MCIFTFSRRGHFTGFLDQVTSVEIFAGGFFPEDLLGSESSLVPMAETFETSVIKFMASDMDPRPGDQLAIQLTSLGVATFFEDVRVIPEPSSALLLGVGLAVLAGRNRRH